jgi:hypothetical protein
MTSIKIPLCANTWKIVEDIDAVMNLFSNSTLRRVHYALHWKQLRGAGVRVLRPIFPSATRWNWITIQAFRFRDMNWVLESMPGGKLGYKTPIEHQVAFQR